MPSKIADRDTAAAIYIEDRRKLEAEASRREVEARRAAEAEVERLREELARLRQSKG